MKAISKLIVFTLVALAVCAAFWLLRPRAPVASPELPVVGQSSEASPLAEPTASQAAEAAPDAVEPLPATSDEGAGTARMYAAHAPLRVPEVADPDSEANKAILETMVLKALARQAAEPVSDPAGN